MRKFALTPIPLRAAKYAPTAAGLVALITASAITAGTATADTATPDQAAVISQPVSADGSEQPGPSPAAPVDPGQEYLDAFSRVAGAFALDSTSGRVVGTAAGIVIGCPLGAVTGGALTLPTAVLTPVGIVGGCVIGASTLGFFGGLAGSLITGSPAGVNALNQEYGALRAKGLIAAPGPDTSTAR
ncbi:hypothetical protein [Nocardia sp. CA-120079]|uniref:hypothetical protein n=1 Tax=Nocardia sp. CA-120079 TaxID=3239974 RepID=UPI003D95B9E5